MIGRIRSAYRMLLSKSDIGREDDETPIVIETDDSYYYVDAADVSLEMTEYGTGIPEDESIHITAKHGVEVVSKDEFQ